MVRYNSKHVSNFLLHHYYITTTAGYFLSSCQATLCFLSFFSFPSCPVHTKNVDLFKCSLSVITMCLYTCFSTLAPQSFSPSVLRAGKLFPPPARASPHRSAPPPSELHQLSRTFLTTSEDTDQPIPTLLRCPFRVQSTVWCFCPVLCWGSRWASKRAHQWFHLGPSLAAGEFWRN